MKTLLRRAPVGVCLLWAAATASWAAAPHSVICNFERTATATLDAAGRITTAAEQSSGELVISNLNSAEPIGTANAGTAKLRVLRRTPNVIWLAEMDDQEVLGFVTLFLDRGLVMYTKHESLRTLSGEVPYGFVEIGKCRTPR